MNKIILRGLFLLISLSFVAHSTNEKPKSSSNTVKVVPFEMSGNLKSDVIKEAKKLVQAQKLDLPLEFLFCSINEVSPRYVSCHTETNECPSADQCLEDVYTIYFELDENRQLQKKSLKIIHTGR